MLAALLRQGAPIDPAAWRLPEEPLFWELRDLVLHVPALVEQFGPPPSENLWWTPPVRQALQVLQAERGALAVADKTSHRDLAKAFEVLTAAGLPDDWWLSWLGELCEAANGAPLGGPLLVGTIERWLTQRAAYLLPRLPPDLLLWLWETPSLQPALLATLVRVSEPAHALRLGRALQAAAAARPVDLQDLLERWHLALLNQGSCWTLAHTGDRGFLLQLVQTALAKASPERALRLYDELPDPLSAALFLHELSRRPAAELQELRNLARPVDAEWKERRASRFWLSASMKRSNSR